MADSRIDDLRQRLERDPGSRLFAHLAEELRKAGEVEEAISVARAGLEQHPSYPSARLTLGRALLDAGDAAAARAELETAVREAPDNILASRVLGEALEALGDLGAALGRYRRTLEMAPGDPQVQARVHVLQERVGGGSSPATGVSTEAGEATKPMAAVQRPEEPRAPTGEAAEPNAPGEGAADLPPTVRVRMPADPRGEPRAPLPPTRGAGEAAGADPPPPVSPGRHRALEEPLPPTLPMGVRTVEVGRKESPRPGPEEPAASANGPPESTRAVAPEAGSGPGGAGGPDARQPPLSSATLAELYLQQGLLGRAVEVLRQVLEEEPGNDAVRTRLAEIETLARDSAADPSVPGPDEGDERAARRRALERTIEGLEALLAVVRRGR